MEAIWHHIGALASNDSQRNSISNSVDLTIKGSINKRANFTGPEANEDARGHGLFLNLII
jgi:hypothetical protein